MKLAALWSVFNVVYITHGVGVRGAGMSGAQADSERGILLLYKKRGDYLRFLNSHVPFISVTYWNPFSIRLAASFGVAAVLHVYSSSSLKWISCVCSKVVSIFLCPICCLTYRMSLVFV